MQPLIIYDRVKNEFARSLTEYAISLRQTADSAISARLAAVSFYRFLLTERIFLLFSIKILIYLHQPNIL